MNETTYLILILVIASVVVFGPDVLFFRSPQKSHRHAKYQREARTITERIIREGWDDTTPVYKEETTRVKNAEYKPTEETEKPTLSPLERVKNMGGH